MTGIVNSCSVWVSCRYLQILNVPELNAEPGG
jgi:hypothetical protein